MDTRPTTDKVKESLFNIIQFELEGRRVLDLFAGTGQLGLEALSRGAEGCVFVDQRREAAALVRENVKLCRFEDRAQGSKGRPRPSCGAAGRGLTWSFWTRPITPICWSSVWKKSQGLTFCGNMV